MDSGELKRLVDSAGRLHTQVEELLSKGCDGSERLIGAVTLGDIAELLNLAIFLARLGGGEIVKHLSTSSTLGAGSTDA